MKFLLVVITGRKRFLPGAQLWPSKLQFSPGPPFLMTWLMHLGMLTHSGMTKQDSLCLTFVANISYSLPPVFLFRDMDLLDCWWTCILLSLPPKWWDNRSLPPLQAPSRFCIHGWILTYIPLLYSQPCNFIPISIHLDSLKCSRSSLQYSLKEKDVRAAEMKTLRQYKVGCGGTCLLSQSLRG